MRTWKMVPQKGRISRDVYPRGDLVWGIKEQAVLGGCPRGLGIERWFGNLCRALGKVSELKCGEGEVHAGGVCSLRSDAQVDWEKVCMCEQPSMECWPKQVKRASPPFGGATRDGVISPNRLKRVSRLMDGFEWSFRTWKVWGRCLLNEMSGIGGWSPIRGKRVSTLMRWGWGWPGPRGQSLGRVRRISATWTVQQHWSQTRALVPQVNILRIRGGRVLTVGETSYSTGQRKLGWTCATGPELEVLFGMYGFQFIERNPNV